MNDKVKTAVVILNWNGAEMLRRFLPSVIEHSQGEGVAVYVADNASTDESCQVVEDEFPSVRLIRLDRNYGFADGYNKALEQVEAEYAVLLNSDVEVGKNWLALMSDYMDAHPKVAACQPKILSWREKTRFEYAGAAVRLSFLPWAYLRLGRRRPRAIRWHYACVLGNGSGVDDSVGGLSGSGRIGRTFLRSHGRNRFVLAFA